MQKRNPDFDIDLFLILFFILLALFIFSPSSSCSETLYVCTRGDDLNGRAAPSKSARVEAHFPNGEALEAVSYHDGWVEVIGGETGTVWCSQKYLSSSQEARKYRNTSGGRVFVRDEINGRKTGLEVRSDKVVTIYRQIDGWGYIGTGWVDLTYFEEENH